MKLLILDNYDSFTYNIVELLHQLGVSDCAVCLNDKITSIEAATFDKIIISPGPSIPSAAGNTLRIIQDLAPTHSILGICLGHQAIAEAFGAQLKNLSMPCHGFQTELSMIKNFSNKKNLFHNVSSPCKVGLYHSWTVDESSLPTCLEVSSYSKEGRIMSLHHTEYDVYGVQFHPESYMTNEGLQILKNWLN